MRTKIALAGLLAGADVSFLPATTASAGCYVENPDRGCLTAACNFVVETYDDAREAAGLGPSYIFCID